MGPAKIRCISPQSSHVIETPCAPSIDSNAHFYSKFLRNPSNRLPETQSTWIEDLLAWWRGGRSFLTVLKICWRELGNCRECTTRAAPRRGLNWLSLDHVCILIPLEFQFISIVLFSSSFHPIYGIIFHKYSSIIFLSQCTLDLKSRMLSWLIRLGYFRIVYGHSYEPTSLPHLIQPPHNSRLTVPPLVPGTSRTEISTLSF